MFFFHYFTYRKTDTARLSNFPKDTQSKQQHQCLSQATASKPNAQCYYAMLYFFFTSWEILDVEQQLLNSQL